MLKKYRNALDKLSTVINNVKNNMQNDALLSLSNINMEIKFSSGKKSDKYDRFVAESIQKSSFKMKLDF